MKANERAALRWLEKIDKTVVPHFTKLLWDESRYLVLYGGAGSGKSYFAAQKIMDRCAGERGHRILVIRKIENTIKESVFALLKYYATTIYAADVKRVYTNPMRILFYNNSEIIFRGIDNPEKIKSVYDITGLWIEEASELAEDDFLQLDLRLRAKVIKYYQVILSFNPISVTHWLKKRFFGDIPDSKSTVDKSTYQDNPHLSQQYIDTLTELSKHDPYYYTVYALGEWGAVGISVFNASEISKRLAQLPERTTKYIFNGDELIPSPDGYISVYKEPSPGEVYTIGVDTSGNGSDYMAAHVIDSDGKQCAVLHRQSLDDEALVDDIERLGYKYNTALVGVECNFNIYHIKKLEERGYPNQYIREVEDTYTGSIRQTYGFITSGKTRPIIISELVAFMTDGIDKINDRATLEEMLTFVRNEELRPEAVNGAHDDLVMSLAIANHIRASAHTSEPTVDMRKWSEDMRDDYRHADAATRKHLAKIWGGLDRRE